MAVLSPGAARLAQRFVSHDIALSCDRNSVSFPQIKEEAWFYSWTFASLWPVDYGGEAPQEQDQPRPQGVKAKQESHASKQSLGLRWLVAT